MRFYNRFRKCSESDFKIALWVRAIDVARALQSIIPSPRRAASEEGKQGVNTPSSTLTCAAT